MRWRGLVLLGIALSIQLILGVTGTPWPLLVASMGLIAAFLFINRERAGFPLALTGLLLNLVVIAANGAMPVSAHAAAIADPGLAIASSDQRHIYATPETHLNLLGDVIPFAGKVLSIGDILMALGLVWFVGSAGRRQLGKGTAISLRQSL